MLFLPTPELIAERLEIQADSDARRARLQAAYDSRDEDREFLVMALAGPRFDAFVPRCNPRRPSHRDDCVCLGRRPVETR